MTKEQFKLEVDHNEQVFNFIDNIHTMDSGERTGVIVALNFIVNNIKLTENENYAIQHIIDYALTCKPMK